MRKIGILLLALISAASLISLAFAAVKKLPIRAKVTVYYFHGTFRCQDCVSMEDFCKGTVERNFKSFITAKKLEFKSINIERYGNEHFVDDFQLYTRSLVIALVKNGKQVRFKNLEYIWEFAEDQDKLLGYIMGEVDAFLKEMGS